MILSLLICYGTLCQPHELPIEQPSWFVGSQQQWCDAARVAWEELNPAYEIRSVECLPLTPEALALIGQ